MLQNNILHNSKSKNDKLRAEHALSKSNKSNGKEQITVPKSVGKLMIKVRNEKGLSHTDLGNKSQVPIETIIDWESGKSVWDKKVGQDICKGLEIPFKEFEELLKKESNDKK